MEYESKRTLEDLLSLLTRLDLGVEPTSAEQAELEAVEIVDATRYTDILPRSMKKLKNLYYLKLRNAAINDLSPLSELHNLQSLDLANTPVNDLTPLAELHNLKFLVFPGTQVSDVSPLARLYNLQSLDLSCTQISDISPLAGLRSLKSLKLWRTKVSDISPLTGLGNLQYLNLHSTQINDISPFSELYNLQSLDLHSTQIYDLSPLSKLYNLQSLDLHNTQIRNLSPLSKLLSLQSLDLHNTQVKDFSSLSVFHNLKSLDLTSTQIQDISPLTELHNLKILKLSNTQVSNLLPLAKLYKLQSLELQNTKVNDLSPLTKLRKLHYLDLKYTYAHDITPLKGLRKLNRLGLSGLALQSIPKPLFNLNLPFIFNHVSDKKRYIELIGSTISTQPISLFQQDRRVIRAYYDAELVDVREAKVIFLGDGGAGKTHTIKRILKNGTDDTIDTRTTLGISITNYPATGNNGPFRINFWDFGGQENMHAMHRCFLTERTCYVVVISNRWNLDTQARYWLDNVRSFAPKAPVILAVNKWEGISACPMDTNRLYQDYPNLRDVTLYTAKGGDPADFTATLTRFIVRHAEELDSNAMQLPVDWAAIRQELVELADNNEWYIDHNKYYEICERHGLGGIENNPIRTWLLDWLNDLGVCFSHHENQNNYNVLNPRWLTSAIYILLNSNKNYSQNGIMPFGSIETLLEAPSWDKLCISDERDDIPDYILTEQGFHPKTGTCVLRPLSYEKEQWLHILAVMRKFELSYPVSNNEEFIPALCDSEIPKNLYPTQYHSRISYEFRYSFLPDSVVQRLMVRMCRHRQFSALWRNGFRFEETSQKLITVVDAGGPHDTLRIDVFSHEAPGGKDMVMMLASQIRDIQQAMGMTAEEFIVVHGPKGEIPVPADMVLSAWEKNIPELYLYNKENGLFAKSVREILGEAYTPEILEKARELAAEKKCSMPEAVPMIVQYYTIQGNYIQGDYNNTDPKHLLNLLNNLIEQNYHTNQSFVDHLLKQLEKSESENARMLAREAKADPEKKRNILGTLLSAVGNTTSFLADSPEAIKTISSIASAVTTAISVYGPKVAEFISNHPPIILPL